MASESINQTLAQLGATTEEQVIALFAEVSQRFDAEVARNFKDQESWKLFLVAWTGRKSGVLSQITDNWLKPASPQLKRAVGQELNKLKAHIEAALEEKQRALDASAEQA